MYLTSLTNSSSISNSNKLLEIIPYIFLCILISIIIYILYKFFKNIYIGCFYNHLINKELNNINNLNNNENIKFLIGKDVKTYNSIAYSV
jgi:hypothetical protein